MAYRFNFSGGNALVGAGLLWQDEFLFNYQPLFSNTYTELDFSQADITTAQEIFTEIPVVSELPNFAPPLAVDDNLLASNLNTTFNLFADNGLGADSDADGDNLLVTMINGTIISIGTVITLNNGLEVTYLGGGDVAFNTVGLSLSDFASDVFNYTIDDGNGGTDTANVTISFVVNALNLATLSAADGYRIFGAPDGMGSGVSVSGLGDVNGDKIDDYIIGAPFAGSGAAYVVFGSVAGFPTGLDLATLNGVNGFRVDGLAAFDNLGRAVSSAGDINGDGIADILIGAPSGGATGAFGTSDGEAYVIFGSSAGFPANFNLTNLDGTNGFVITARPADIGLGFAVRNAGDVNGDGIDDLLVGSLSEPEAGQFATAFVVYGTNTGFAAQIDLALLDGTDGFIIPSLTPIDGAGEAVTALGDVNGDGIDDFAVGAPNADAAFGTFSFTGETYVIFGNAPGLGASFDLATLNGANGFVINAIASGAGLGHSVTGIGDINGDGLADILIGAPSADNSSGVARAGQVYVVYGASSFTASLDLSSLNGLNGFVINGINGFDNTGYSVSGVGDFNGDGIADFVIGAKDADPNGNSNAGQTYLIFGGSFSANPIFDVADLDGTNGFALLGARAGDNSGYSVSGAGDVNNDGFDDLLIGAPRANNFGNGAQGENYIIYGFDPLGVGNTPPIAADDNFTTNEDNPVTGTVFADNGNGADSDSDGDAIFVSAVNALAANVGANIQGSTGGIFVIQSDGTFSFRANGDFDYLAVGESETTTTSYTVSDGNGGTDIATVTVTVTGVN
ncbi:MAG: Ig-like domain-containing protein, partial [Robiginitomaculum sp.]|nr:Ig-like domain-containing protein [Robiginitomaculum sp.]